MRSDVKLNELETLEEILYLFKRLANQARNIHSYGGREEVLQLKAHDGAREVVRDGGQILSDAKEALKK